MALHYIAGQPEGTRPTAKEIARYHNIPYELLAKILQHLVKKGIVGSEQGVKGGYFLHKKETELTLSEVVEAIEGPIRLTTCNSDVINKSCELAETCEVKKLLREIQNRVEEVFRNTTISEII